MKPSSAKPAFKVDLHGPVPLRVNPMTAKPTRHKVDGRNAFDGAPNLISQRNVDSTAANTWLGIGDRHKPTRLSLREWLAQETPAGVPSAKVHDLRHRYFERTYDAQKSVVFPGS